ncbi:MAG: PepSY-associated TM helix domain-containing protein [Agriterribacter sp.]
MGIFNTKKAVINQKGAKKATPSRFRKMIGWLHLWLGLVSGIIVLFLGVTGCILAFEQEIRNVTQPYLFVQQQNKPFYHHPNLIHGQKNTWMVKKYWALNILAKTKPLSPLTMMLIITKRFISIHIQAKY